ncbi:MAG: LysM peptidoglycan-binding domain-containing protein [Lachnospiraceae bacterium]|nr:LysM peptidoglycan-binding domain-containing protein [Lachnospiraceae bacterium]
MAKTRSVLISTDGGQFELAVNPKQIQLSSDNGDKSIDLLNIGTVMLPGHRNPVKISIQTFLPAPGSPFYRGVSPDSMISMVEKAKNGQKSIRIIISGTNVNHKFIVNSAAATYTEGQNDVQVAWSFTEDRFSSITVVASMANRYTATGLSQRPDTQETPKSVTVKVGDTLWGFAVQYYGDGTRWQDIAQQNGIIDPKKLPVGKVLEIPQ